MAAHDHSRGADRQPSAQQFPTNQRLTKDLCLKRKRPQTSGLDSMLSEQYASALAELLAPARAVQADLLALDFARIARHEAGMAQGRLERCVVVEQRTGDAVTYRASLPRFAAAMHVDLHVEGCIVRGENQRLLDDHDGRLAAEVLLDRLAVHENLSRALFHEHASHRRLAAAGSVVPISY